MVHRLIKYTSFACLLLKKWKQAQRRKDRPLATVDSRSPFTFLAGTLVIGTLMIFAELSYFHLDRSARGYVSKRKATSVVAEHSKNLSYYKKLLGLPDYAKDQATVTQPVRESFFTQREKKCHNCLPNYFIRAGESDKSKYRRGTVAFLHHLKSGGTTMHSCLRKLLSRPYTWNGKTSVNQVYKEGLALSIGYFGRI